MDIQVKGEELKVDGMSVVVDAYFKAYHAFLEVLRRTKIRIHGRTTFDRDMRDLPWSDGFRDYGQRGAPWWCAKLECSDSDDPNYLGAKSEIFWPMFYSEHNSDDQANHWGDVPVVVVDSCFAGANTKEIIVDGTTRWKYSASAPHGPWIHYNMKTGEVVFL